MGFGALSFIEPGADVRPLNEFRAAFAEGDSW